MDKISLQEKSEKILKSYAENSIIIMMGDCFHKDNFEDFLNKSTPYLKQYNNQIIVFQDELNTLDETDPIIMKNIINYNKFCKKNICMVDSSSTKSLPEFYKEFIIKNRYKRQILIITQDCLSAINILALNKSRNEQEYKVYVKRINGYSYLANFKLDPSTYNGNRKICVECGREFTIEDGEYAFYKRENLCLPKRCALCRAKNKNQNEKHTNKEIEPVNYNSKPKEKKTLLDRLRCFLHA